MSTLSLTASTTSPLARRGGVVRPFAMRERRESMFGGLHNVVRDITRVVINRYRDWFGPGATQAQSTLEKVKVEI